MLKMRSASDGNETTQAQPAPPKETTSAARIPRIAITGEANSGKTTLVNFLLRAQLLAVDIVPNTPCPTLLRFADAAHIRVHLPDGTVAIRSLAELHRIGRNEVPFVEVCLPSAVLRRIEILDMPGFGSRSEAEAKDRWLKTADIQIWCTPATQAWKASEQETWLALARQKTSAFLVLTHRDLLSDKQLGEVSERMSRETGRYFSHWSAIATPEAIASRNPRGQIVKKEVWTSTGVEDFMKKLIDLLQTVIAPRNPAPRPEPTPAPSPVPAVRQPNPAMPHPLTAFPHFQKRILKELQGQMPPQQSARILSSGLEAYAEKILKPWIAANPRSSKQAVKLEGLLRIPGTEIEDYLAPRPADPATITPAKILHQIGAELAEAFPAAAG